MSHLRRFLCLGLLVACRLPAQTADSPAQPSTQPTTQPASQPLQPSASTDLLPDSPGALASAPFAFQSPQLPGPCTRPQGAGTQTSGTQKPVAQPPAAPQTTTLCYPPPNPYLPFLTVPVPVPLTPAQKAYLALHDIIDPFNLLTIVANSAFTVAIDPHTAYGPGLQGFGRNVGISMVEDATAEVIGTFAVCTLFHQDPHYYRMPQARPLRRLAHAIAHVAVAQSDSGKLIPNYENLITTTATVEISNLYVPGNRGNGPSTVSRILLGLATEPIGTVVAEFLPDLARRIHVRFVILQHILDQVARGEEM